VEVSVEVSDAGGLALNIAESSTDLGVTEIDSTLSFLEAFGALPTVTVADTRAANPGWSLTATISEFTGSAGEIDGNALGIAPKVLSSVAGQSVTAGPVVEPGVGFTGGTNLATAAPGGGRGTVTVGADLHFQVPTNTAPGNYVAELTVTVI
jgi:hypothetical protein